MESPNEAPKECWLSARECRNILFKAGQHQGLAGEKYLDRIPNPDLRLFAQIELCAAIEGLPQMGGGMPNSTKYSVQLRRVFVALAELGVSGRHARRTFGPVSVGIVGIHSTLAESARNAATGGKKRRVRSVAKCRRMRNGMNDKSAGYDSRKSSDMKTLLGSGT